MFERLSVFDRKFELGALKFCTGTLFDILSSVIAKSSMVLLQVFQPLRWALVFACSVQSTVVVRMQYGARAQLRSQFATAVPSFYARVPFRKGGIF